MRGRGKDETYLFMAFALRPACATSENRRDMGIVTINGSNIPSQWPVGFQRFALLGDWLEDGCSCENRVETCWTYSDVAGTVGAKRAERRGGRTLGETPFELRAREIDPRAERGDLLMASPSDKEVSSSLRGRIIHGFFSI